MRNFLKIALVTTFVILGAFAYSSSAKSNSGNAKIITTENAENAASAPRDLYVRNCARCHGANGKGETELGETLGVPDLTTNKTSVAKNVQVITNGLGGMPAFRKKMKKADIAAVANYVRGL